VVDLDHFGGFWGESCRCLEVVFGGRSLTMMLEFGTTIVYVVREFDFGFEVMLRGVFGKRSI